MLTFKFPRVLLTLAASTVLMYALASPAFSQTMNFSVYVDTSVGTDSTIYAGINSIDNSSGCYHSLYTIDGYITSPSGRYASASGSTGVYLGLPYEDEEGSWEFGAEGSVYCTCIYGTFGYGSGQYRGVSGHVTYYKDNIGSSGNTCLYGSTNCLAGTTPLCVGGVALAGPGISPPDCPPFVVVFYIAIYHEDGTYECGSIGSGASETGACS